MQDVVAHYNKFLSNDAEESGKFDDYDFNESFIKIQNKVQEAYGDDTEIYKTLNPKHS